MGRLLAVWGMRRRKLLDSGKFGLSKIGVVFAKGDGVGSRLIGFLMIIKGRSGVGRRSVCVTWCNFEPFKVMTFLNLIRPVISAVRALAAFVEEAHYALFIQPYEESLVPVRVPVKDNLE